MKNLTKLAIAAGVAALTTAAHAETYGIFFGVADYPQPLDAQGQPLKDKDGKVIDLDLSGCVNDAKDIQALSESTYGLKPSNIIKFYDSNANIKNFETAWLDTLKKMKPGDQVLFFYSGHGGQIPTQAANEEDKLDEVIVLGDGGLVVDDIFEQISSILKANDMHGTFVFDCCYSGGMSRDAGYKTKIIPQLKTGAIKNYKKANLVKFAIGNSGTMRPKMDYAFMPKQSATMAAAAVAAPRKDEGSWAFLNAGQENEPTIDLGARDNIPANGLYTTVLKIVLKEFPTMAAKDMSDAMADLFVEKKFPQKPSSTFSSAARGKQPFLLP